MSLSSELPTLTVEVLFPSGASTGTIFHFDDPARGVIGTATLGSEDAWVDVTPYVESFSIKRGATRYAGPIVRYEPGSAEILLRNEDRRFDPTNLSGPYVVSGISQVTPMRAVRILETWGSTTNAVQNPWLQDGSTTGWNDVSVGTISAVNVADAPVYFGGYSLKVTSDTVGGVAVMSISVDLNGGFISAGSPITLSAYLYIPTASLSLLSAIAFAANDSTSISVVNATFVAAPAANTWTRVSLSGTAAVAVDTGSKFVIQFWTNGGFTSGDIIAYVDAAQVVSASAVETFTDNSTTYELFRGFADEWKIEWQNPNYSRATLSCTDAFKVFRNYDRTAVIAVGAGENSGARINRILDGISWSSTDRVIATGDTTLQATTLAGSALSEMQVVADTEAGELYIDGGGRVFFRNRQGMIEDQRSTKPQAHFNSSTGAALTVASIAVSYDDVQLVNSVSVTRVGGTVQTQSDASSIALYLTRTSTRTDLIMTTDADAANYAGYVVMLSKDPELRFDSLTVNLRSNPGAMYPLVLGREIGDRIRVTKTPPGGGSPIIKDVIVRGIQYSGEAGKRTMTWQFQSATKFDSFFTLDSATLGFFDEDRLGY